MKSKIAIYDSHEKAVNALKTLAEHGFPMKSVSLIGKSEVTDDHIHITSNEPIKNAPALIGAGAGTILGLLAGVGVFAIPGFGFLYGAGALIGTIAGFDLGIITGGLGTLLLTLGIKEEYSVKYAEHLAQGKFIIIVHDKEEIVLQAEKILHADGTHEQID